MCRLGGGSCRLVELPNLDLQGADRLVVQFVECFGDHFVGDAVAGKEGCCETFGITQQVEQEMSCREIFCGVVTRQQFVGIAAEEELRLLLGRSGRLADGLLDAQLQLVELPILQACREELVGQSPLLTQQFK